MCRSLRHQHRHVAADRGKLRQRLERFRRIAPREQLVQIQFREENRIAQIVFFCQGRQQLAEFTQRELSTKGDGGGLKEELRTFSTAKGHAANTEVFQKFFQHAFQVKDIQFGVAFIAAPKGQRTLPGQGDGNAPSFPGCARLSAENASDLKQGHVIIFSADVVSQRMDQSR